MFAYHLRAHYSAKKCLWLAVLRREGLMRFFHWLFGRKSKAPDQDLSAPAVAQGQRATGAKMPRPANVRRLGAGSPFVSFEQGGAMIVMDQDAFDYTYGDADGP